MNFHLTCNVYFKSKENALEFVSLRKLPFSYSKQFYCHSLYDTDKEDLVLTHHRISFRRGDCSIYYS